MNEETKHIHEIIKQASLRKITRYEEIRICKYCGDEFIVRKKDKKRKYCDKHKGKMDFVCHVSILKEKNRINYLLSTTNNIKLNHSQTYGISLLIQYRKQFKYTASNITKEEIIKFLENTKKDIQINIDKLNNL